LAVLPYAWGRTLIITAIQHRPEWPFVALLAIGLAAVIALSWRLGGAFPRPAAHWAVGLAVAVPWVVVMGGLMAAHLETEIPRAVFLPLFVLATLWVPWAGWMFFRPVSGWVRWPVLGLLLGAVGVDRLLFSVDLAGEGIVRVTWRQPQSSATKDSSFRGKVDLTRVGKDDFPQFLGPDRSGVLPRAHLAGDWDKHPPRLLWRQSVGAGWGGFAVVGGFALTQEQLEAGESVVCYRVADGRVAWVHWDPVSFDSGLGGPGPRATPAVAGGRVYTVGATGLLNCLDGASGEKIWAVNILRDNDAENIYHGVSGSPLVVDELVIVSPTGRNGLCLAAYDRTSGRRVWRAGSSPASYGSPMLARLHGVRQVLLFTTEGITAHELRTGKLLWTAPWTNSEQVNCSQPIPNAGGADHVFVSTGYGKGCALFQIDHPSGGAWSVEKRWQKPFMKTKFTTAVVRQGFIYGLDDGVLECLDLKTGRRRWKGERYKHGQLLLAGDLLVVQAEDGYVALVKAAPDRPHELGRIAALSDKTWNNPALAGRYLLVRNDRKAVCYRLPPAK
jgi:outer membrane protein assembly factor BamB